MSAKDAVPTELRSLRSVVAAIISNSGTLIDGNAGFSQMARALFGDTPVVTVAPLFIQPTLSNLMGLATQQGTAPYCGMLTMGLQTSRTWTFTGTFYAQGGNWVLIAEQDNQDLDAVRQSLFTLNRELANTQREMKRTMQSLSVKNDLIEHLSVTDDLTGLGNRRHFNEAIASEMARARRTGLPIVMVMIDIDHFKTVNDVYGHAAGDKVLKEFSRLISLELRVTDTSTRYGGEEFVLVLPATRLAEAGQLVERLRLAFQSLRPLDSERVVTASFGVAEWRHSETGEQWLMRADSAMYQAKAQGRNRVVMDFASLVEMSL